MRRRTKPAKTKVQGKQPSAGKSPKTDDARVRDLEMHLAKALKDRAEALEQQTATSEILTVISSSPTDVQPVFDAIAKSAMLLCEASVSGVLRFDGALVHIAALRNVDAEGARALRSAFPMPPSRQSASARAILTRSIVHIPDVFDDPEHGVAAQVQTAGFRSVLSVPMVRGGSAIGGITVGRSAPGRFSDRQIELLKTFADQAVIAIENVRLFRELEARNRDLTESLHRQTATADILQAISRSPTDTQPVFEAIADSALRLFRARTATVFRLEGEFLHPLAARGGLPNSSEAIQYREPQRVTRDFVSGRCIVDRSIVHVADVETDPDAPARTREIAAARGFRAALCVPLLKDSYSIGTIAVSRAEPGRFSDEEIALLRTFADQAVIAIENVRLFTELQEKNRALTEAHGPVAEALEQQTATSEILKVIARSPTDAQPVFDAIVENAARLCSVGDGYIILVEDEVLRAVSVIGQLVAQAPVYNTRRVPLSRESVAGRAIVDRATIHIADLAAVSEAEFPEVGALQRLFGHHTMLATPLLREGAALGVIVVFRFEVRPFSERQMELLKTFADQAVIAIENVRLFTELQASNRELTTALDTQTATSDILRVISRSQTDVQPVFDAIVSSAVRLLGAYAGSVTRVAGDQLEFAALTSTDDAGDAALRARFPQSLHSEEPHPQAIRARVPLNIADAHTDPRLSEAVHAYARVRGFRSQVVVPLLHHDDAVGTIGVVRREPGGFTDDEIALLKTFADQAVIAIENVRLFKELQTRTQELTRSVEQLTALGEVGRAVSSTLDLETVLTTIVSRAAQLSGLDGGVVFEYDENAEEFVQRAAAETGGVLAQARRGTRFRKGEGVLGRTAITLEPVQVPDITVPGAYDSRLRENLIESGIRAILAVPMVREGQLIGCLGVTRNRPGEFPAETIELLRTFATQSALAIQNARLFREIEDKSRQLEAASRHKSEFLANMSHELRTPLNAIIGFSEVLAERMFGEVNAKQAEYLQDILESGRHLLSLINDILDLSKIEAGRMELEPADFHLPSAIDNALILVRERATRRGISLGCLIDGGLGLIRGDERKVKQVLLNLLSNALKFTPEGGRIDVRAALHGGVAEVSVADTGVGIAPEDQAAVFEEFRQVGTADKKVEGTGLGLALSQKFVQLHGGRLWVESELGRGSTFTFTLPVG